jgi:hypothetical protein
MPLVEGGVRPWTSAPGCADPGLGQYDPMKTKRGHEAAAARPVMLTPLGNLAILKEDGRYLEMAARLDTGMPWPENPRRAPAT